MYKDRSSRCDSRIVSISQPHVRPIVTGKAGKKIEFGAKISVSMTDGLAFVDHIGCDAFNKSKDLK
jgi:IS5 family transposase